MCHKYALDVWGDYLKNIKALYGEDLPASSEIFPGQDVTVFTDIASVGSISQHGIRSAVTDQFTVSKFRWGLLPHWAKSPKISFSTYNARSETADSSPAFRSAFAQRPCLIPASGFFEFSGSGKSRISYFFTVKDRECFTFAGIYDIWIPSHTGADLFNNQPVIISCSILTTSPNSLVAEIHDRMPVILSPENESLWLQSNLSISERKALCTPFPAEKMKTETQ